MNKKENESFIKLLKKYTTIDKKFIDTFFKKFKIGGELNFDIKDTNVAKYLEIKIETLRKRLLNMFSKNKIYIKNVDYIKIKSNKTSGVTYMINYQCFERLAMSGDSKKSESIRLYFVKLREFMTEHQKIIYQALIKKSELKKFEGYESIYFFAISEKDNILKVGRTTDIIKRLRNYNVGRIKEVNLKYYVLVKNAELIENCIKLKLKKNQLIENREIYKIDPQKLKKVITDCYCKYVTKKENNTMYKEIGELLGLYSYTKDKKNIKPYVIINKK